MKSLVKAQKVKFKKNMNRTTVKILFPILMTVTLFSYWAGFALLVVNKIFYKDLPGYTIGRICIWEFIAIIIAGLITYILIKKWGNAEIRTIETKDLLVMNPKYGIYFGFYLVTAILVGIWQFWIFSQNF